MIVTLVVLVSAFALGACVGKVDTYDPKARFDGKYGATPAANCDAVAGRIGKLPKKASDSSEGHADLGGGWLCEFRANAEGVSLHFSLDTVSGQRVAFDRKTSQGFVRDATVGVGEEAAWFSGNADLKQCSLSILDSNAIFEIHLHDGGLPAKPEQLCRERVTKMARAFYEVVQPR